MFTYYDAVLSQSYCYDFDVVVAPDCKKYTKNSYLGGYTKNIPHLKKKKSAKISRSLNTFWGPALSLGNKGTDLAFTKQILHFLEEVKNTSK